MKNIFISFLFCLFCTSIAAQELDSIAKSPEDKKKSDKKNLFDALSKKVSEEFVNEESGKANYLDYKIISHFNDTILVDTTLTIQKEYKMNYLRKDLFGMHAFQNQGQVFTKLVHSFDSPSILPALGAKSKHIDYYEVEDIKYYRVPTPTSEFFYKTGIEQGQVLDSWLAINMHERLNFSLAYKGMRSLGAYRNSLTSHTNFRGTVSYQSKNKRYQLKTHITSQNLQNQENGGLIPTALELYESNNSEFTDRGRLDVNLEDAVSLLVGKRYYIDQSYKLFKTKDSVPHKISNLRFGHIFNYETKQYRFNASSTSFFGSSFKTTTTDKTSNKTMNNQAYLDFTSPYVLGNFRVFANYYHFFHGYKNVIYSNTQTVSNQLKGNVVSVGANWNSMIKNIYFSANATTMLTGDLTGSNLYGKASYKNKKNIEIAASLQINSKSPDFNFLLFQSNYVAYNWQNNFKNIDTRNFIFDVKTKWLNASATATQIKNYIYFNEDSQPTPTQYSGTVNYLKLKANNEFKLGDFSLNNTLLYQKVANGSSVFRVPQLISRNTLYFSKLLFKEKSLYLQTGVTASYFSAYQANIYNPVIGEFALQNVRNIGGKPILDIFANGQIRRTRIYIRAENILSKINKATYYASPNQPYKDFVIRFGIVWNFFN